MSELDFDARLGAQLRAYSDGGVRPIDRYAIARATVAGRRAAPGWRWSLRPVRRAWLPIVVGLVLLAIVAGGAILVGSRPPTPSPTSTPTATGGVPGPLSYRGELVAGGEMSTPRDRPTVVALGDGRVLIAGGTSAEIFDPATGHSVPARPMVAAGSEIIDAAVLLHDGRVLLVGFVPSSGPDTGISEIFDPGTMSFSSVGPMVTPRERSRLAMLADGRVLIAGGEKLSDNAPTGSTVKPLAAAEIFDPATGAFDVTGSLNTPRFGQAMASLPDGRVLVIGGQDANGTGLVDVADAEVYDPIAGTFADAGSVASIAGGRMSATATLPDGRILVFGHAGGAGTVDGSRVLASIWDNASGAFAIAGSPPYAVTTATALDDGRVFVTGEFGPNTSWSGVYDPATGLTTETGPTRARSPTPVRLKDGRILLVGGIVDGLLHDPGGHFAPAVTTLELFQ